MMKYEFEKLAMRNDKEIGQEMYNSIERFYTSENDYKASHGINGIYETKQDFVKRVFGGKVNTPKSICRKIIAESCRENRYALQGCNVSKERLEEMDKAIATHYETILKYGW